jgi:predicted transcriptional regulator
MGRRQKPPLSPLENAVMQVIWQRDRATADEVRTSLAKTQQLKDSTVRTVLRRLEQKGYVTHSIAGRTFVYTPRIDSRNAAADAIRGILERFCRGSVEDLLVGMVDDEIVSPEKLQELAERINRSEAAGKRKRRTQKGES